MADPAFALGSSYRVDVFAEQTVVDERAVLDLWAREGVVIPEGPERRVAQVLIVATTTAGELAGLSTTYLAHNKQLRMNLWHLRTYVAVAHRMSNVSLALGRLARDHLSRRFVTGEDSRAAGLIYEVENEDLKRLVNYANWATSGFRFIGENRRGAHVRVHYFPGAQAPPPPS